MKKVPYFAAEGAAEEAAEDADKKCIAPALELFVSNDLVALEAQRQVSLLRMLELMRSGIGWVGKN